MPYVLKVSIRKQLVVKPNKRTSHKGNIPNVGGINIFTAFLLSYLLFSVSAGSSDNGKYFLAGLYLIFFVGFLDDLLAFSAKKKFIGEIFAGFIVIVVADIRLTNLHGFFWISEIPDDLFIVSYLSSFFLFFLIINSLNLIDGVDGLATGIGIVICSFFGIYFQLIGELNLALMAYSLIGALALFFIYNVFGKKSKIFMGDSGALVLGYIVYVFVVKFCEVNKTPPNVKYFMYAAPAMSVCILAVPLFDTLRVMFTRIKKGYSPFKADKNHVHHLLLSIGLKHRQVTLILVSVNLTFIALALIGCEWKNSILGAAAALLAIIYTCIMWRVIDKHKKKQQQNTIS
jgi:UDP-N-acetylmuramyl pentapeptide phosphotransferase/UDP-N-acetylglucosamine-1-phosphate transferase